MNVIKLRKQAFKDLSGITHDLSRVLVIHYSHAQIYSSRDDISSPMIIGIMIKSLDSSIYEHFTIPLEADLIGCTREDIRDNFPDLELSLLTKYNDFVKRHEDYYWIHWDMLSVTFGFQALCHRFVKLSGESKTNEFREIPQNKKINLNSILEKMYGTNYIKEKDKLLGLIKKNNLEDVNNYLTTINESLEFDKLNYRIVMQSLSFKVESISILIGYLINNKINLDSKNKYAIVVDFITHPFFNLVGWLATVAGFIAGIIGIAIAKGWI